MPRSRLPWHALSSSATPQGSMDATAVLRSQVLHTCSPQKESIINNAILNRIAALYVFCCMLLSKCLLKRQMLCSCLCFFCRYCHACNTMSYIRKSLCANSYCSLWHGRHGGHSLAPRSATRGGRGCRLGLSHGCLAKQCTS